jgi:hypothetical protein
MSGCKQRYTGETSLQAGKEILQTVTPLALDLKVSRASLRSSPAVPTFDDFQSRDDPGIVQLHSSSIATSHPGSSASIST